VQDSIGEFIQPIQAGINIKLKKGVRLPIPDSLAADLSQTELV